MTESSPDHLRLVRDYPSLGSDEDEQRPPDDHRAPTRRFRLERSVEPGVVFGSLASQVVPDLCDDCTIDVIDAADGTEARYRIAYPPRAANAGGMLRIAARAAADRDHRLRVPFAYPKLPQVPTPADPMTGRTNWFRGHAVFVWHRRMPTSTECSLAQTLVNEAKHTVLWQRTEVAARIAVTDASRLKSALQTSRHIGAAVGILMHRHELTQDQAFAVLNAAGRDSHRMLRDVALDVIDTGDLDPAVVHTIRGRGVRGEHRD